MEQTNKLTLGSLFDGSGGFPLDFGKVISQACDQASKALKKLSESISRR